MIYYVRMTIIGRNRLAEMSKWFNDRGIDAEYTAGGWKDMCLHIVAPHVRFKDEQDALIYVLAFGGEVSTSEPIVGSIDAN